MHLDKEYQPSELHELKRRYLHLQVSGEIHRQSWRKASGTALRRVSLRNVESNLCNQSGRGGVARVTCT